MKYPVPLRSAAALAGPWVASLMLAGGLCDGLTCEAHAQQASSAEPEEPTASSSLWAPWEFWPVLGAGLLGTTGGAALGALLGGEVGLSSCGGAGELTPANNFKCRSEFILSASLGGWIGGTGGSAGAVTLVGWLLEYPGSFTGASIGGGVGMLVGGVVMLLPLVGNLEPEERLPYVLVGLIPPAVGATIGYSLGAPDPAPTHASLVRYSPTRGLELGPPAIGLSLLPDEEAFTLALLGGAF